MAKKIIKKESRKTNLPKKNVNNGEKNVLIYKENMMVFEIAQQLNKPLNVVIMKLMQLGIMANQNQTIDRETTELLCMEFNFEIKDEVITDLLRFDEFKEEDDEEDLVNRPAVVTIMGHVDHGKTTLLDMIRNSRVAKGEAGGITQHIGAYQVIKDEKAITFIDTPGHAAFTQMRARGAKITDIVILVVAADDGVMPQTEEAIHHAKAAKCPIIVAVNKIDKPTANPDRVMEELSRFDLLPSAWGGNTTYVNISALKNIGIDELLEMVMLTAELEDLKANPNKLASGSVIEAELDKGRGPLATFLVQNGTLKVGDYVVCGNTSGRIRTMEDDMRQRYQEALPSTAIVVTGLDSVPKAGDKFRVFTDEKLAKDIASKRAFIAKEKENSVTKGATLEELFGQMAEKKELNLIIKGDVQGSIEALKGVIDKINSENVNINILRASVGTITDSDVILAQASNAIIIGFNVRPMASVRKSAESSGVEIRLYNVIYKIIEDIENALKGMLDPEYEEVVTGQAEVRSIFKLSKVGTIAGCYVTDGVVERNSHVRILRNGIVIYEGEMASLKRFKDDVKEVRQGFECGITIVDFNDIKEYDVFETSVTREIKPK